MQERYLGDSHDFIKYALLRHIHRNTGMQIGINWYLTHPDEVDAPSNNDGEKRHHFTGKYANEWRAWDSDLFDRLQVFEDQNERQIDKVHSAGIMPQNTHYFTDPVTIEKRDDWHRRAMKKLDNTDLVFIDPDNGFLVKSATKPRKPKYSYYSEVADYYRAGKAVIAIQFARQVCPTKRANEVVDRLFQETGVKCELPIIRGRVAPNIIFFAFSPADKASALSDALNSFVAEGFKADCIEREQVCRGTFKR